MTFFKRLFGRSDGNKPIPAGEGEANDRDISLESFIHAHHTFSGQLGPEVDTSLHITPYAALISAVVNAGTKNSSSFTLGARAVNFLDRLPHVADAKQKFDALVSRSRSYVPNIPVAIASERRELFRQLEAARYSSASICAIAKLVCGHAIATPEEADAALAATATDPKRTSSHEVAAMVGNFVRKCRTWEAGQLRPAKESGREAQPASQHAKPLSKTAGNAPAEMEAIESSEAWKLRQQILNATPLRKCGEIPASAAGALPEGVTDMLDGAFAKSGVEAGVCDRLALYRLDGMPMDESELYGRITEFVAAKASKDAQYMSLYLKFAALGFDGKQPDFRGSPVPIVGFTIKLDGDNQDIVAKCEVLATTELMGPSANFMTKGSGFTAQGVAYRAYSYWRQ